MKNKPNSVVSEKRLEKLDPSVERKRLELRAKRKIPSNPLVQKNINFLRNYHEVFGKPQQHFGDADLYFKKSLRSYKSFDLLRELNLGSPKPRRLQRSQFTRHHSEFFESPSTVPPERDNRSELSLKEIFKDTKESESSEFEDKDFLSPLVPFTEEYQEEDFFSPLQTFVEDTAVKNMAEDFQGEDMEEEEEFQGGGEEGDEMKDVEEMIQQASDELQKVAEGSQQMMETLQEAEEDETEMAVTEPKGKGEDGSVFKFDPAIDAAVLQELEEAEKQAKATAKIISELKDRVGELLQKEKMTEAEAKELEDKNKELKAQMAVFEEKTKRIQALLGQANLFDKMAPLGPPLQVKHAEDILPKMLVCGFGEDLMPKIVVCDDKKKCTPKGSRPRSTSLTRKLTDSYDMQERLVSENANLESSRYLLQNDLINQDRTVECLQKQLCTLQNEMRMMQNGQSCPNPSCPKNSRSGSPARSKTGGSCGPGRGLCPAEVESRLQEYSNTTNTLEKQLGDMESEVKNMQQELLEVQKEREHLEHHRRMMCKMPPPCGYPPCPPVPCGYPPCPPMPCYPPPPCGPPPPCCPPEASGDDQRYKELKEKYTRLQEDFKAKLTEVAGLRADNEKLKDQVKAAEDSRKAMEDKVKDLERKLKELRGDNGKGTGTREQIVDLEQQLKVHKEMYRQAQDELEELRALVEDLQGQLNDYRNKYLEAIQTVEEQRRQIEIMRMENNRVSEQVNLEIQRVKNQFQEKLQELAPLPDILKATQAKLQEAQQMHLLAERNNEAMARELQAYKDKIDEINAEMSLKQNDQADGMNAKEILEQRVAELETSEQQLRDENEELRTDMEHLQESYDEKERLANEKLHEITQLETQLESVRDESARQVARVKDRCEIVRKSMQNQISDLERQLAQTKACVKAAERDRDDVRQKMQAQIRNLSDNFEDAQMRIRNLQGHVNFLKNSYCSNGDGAADAPAVKRDPCCCANEY